MLRITVALLRKDSRLIANDLINIAVLQDPGWKCCCVEGDDPLFKTFDHRQVRTSVTQLENVNGKAANVDDVGNRIGLERTVLCYSSRKCLRIAEDFADADRVVFSIVLEVNGLTAPQKVLLKATIELFIVRRGQSDQERDVNRIQRFSCLAPLQFLGDSEESQDIEPLVFGFVAQIRNALFCQRIVAPVPADIVQILNPCSPSDEIRPEVKSAFGVLIDLLP